MASHWAEYATHKEYTNLQYHTALDDKVRESHAALEGITLPYEDPFWNTAFPPNGWNCRCHVVPVLKEDYPVSDSQTAQQSFEMLTEGSEIFRFNPGKQSAIFPPHHPYYGKQGYRHCKNPHLAHSLDSDPSDPCGVYHILKEMMENKDNILIPTVKGKVIETPGINYRERTNNIRTAKYIAETYGDEIYLLADRFEGHSADTYNATKEQFVEYKHICRNTYTAFDNRIREGAKQANDIVLVVKGPYEKSDLIRAIKNRFSRYKKLRSILVIEDYKKDTLILREDAIKDIPL